MIDVTFLLDLFLLNQLLQYHFIFYQIYNLLSFSKIIDAILIILKEIIGILFFCHFQQVRKILHTCSYCTTILEGLTSIYLNFLSQMLFAKYPLSLISY